MTPFHEIKTVPAVRAIGISRETSLWDVDTALSALYDKALDHKLRFSEPALAIRRGTPGVPDPFHERLTVLFPLTGEPGEPIPGTEIVELPEAEVASFVHRGPYQWIPCTYEQVRDWLRKNGLEAAGEFREVFFVAPDPHSGGTQDDMLTEIQVPLKAAA